MVSFAPVVDSSLETQFLLLPWGAESIYFLTNDVRFLVCENTM